MKKRAMILALVLALVLAAVTVTGHASGLFDFSFLNDDSVTISRDEYDELKYAKERLEKYDAIDEVLQFIEMYYLEEPDTDKLMDYAAKGMMAGLGDPYSVYYTAEEWDAYWDDDAGVYVGVGLQLLGDPETQRVTITQVFKGGPAEAAGVRRGDILIRVEDIDVTYFTMQDAVNVMRGVAGEEVEIEVLHNKEAITYRMKRASITVNRIEYTMLQDNVGYIALHEFAGETTKEFTAAFNDLKQRGAKGLIFDLRDNGGGWVQDAINIADLFVDGGLLAYSQDRYGNREDFRLTPGADDIPLVFIVNANTASSSEILSAGLQDLGRATVVGTQSFGKGIIQVVNSLSSGKGGFALTYAQYFTPSGKAVHKVGVTPDVVSELPETDEVIYYELGDLSDPQLKDAFDAVKKLMAD
jgi:carboxyl-terminal processing protease